MNQKFYDNNANDIEYFALHKPKIEVKKKREDIREYTDDQLKQKQDEIKIKLQGLYEMYEFTKSEKTLEAISKLMAFRSAIRIEAKKRNPPEDKDYEKLQSELNQAREKIKILGLQISDMAKQIAENRQVEKTKRHELSVKHDKYVCAYLLEYIKNTVTEQEYAEVIDDVNEIRAKESPL